MQGSADFEALSVFVLASHIREDLQRRTGSIVRMRDLESATGISRSNWSKLLSGPRDVQPSDKTFMLLSAYLQGLETPLVIEGFVVNQNWETLRAMDLLFRRQNEMSVADAIAELKQLRKREEELLAIILSLSEDRSK